MIHICIHTNIYSERQEILRQAGKCIQDVVREEGEGQGRGSAVNSRQCEIYDK
jgi:hypothetical protein